MRLWLQGVEAEHLSAVQRLGLRYRHDIAARLPRQKVATIERVVSEAILSTALCGVSVGLCGAARWQVLCS